jgi:hypothetical protein
MADLNTSCGNFVYKLFFSFVHECILGGGCSDKIEDFFGEHAFLLRLLGDFP